MTPHTVVLMAALAALLGLPCALFRMIRSAEGKALSRSWQRRARWDRPRLNRLERGLTALTEASRPFPEASHSEALASISAAEEAAARAAGEGCGGLDGAGGPGCRCDRVPTPALGLPAVDQVFLELRRLHRQRLGGVTQQSEEWARSVVTAYDRWLQIACAHLSVSHHLSCLTDAMDREIERVRVESELTAAGLPPFRS